MRLYLRVEKRVFEIEADGGRVGSAAGLAVSVRDPSVLAEHAMFSWDGQNWWVTQLGGKPVFLDGVPLRGRQATLGPKGGVQVGNVVMDFWQEGADPPRLTEAGQPGQSINRAPSEQGSQPPLQMAAKLELLSLAQPRSLRGDQIPTLIQGPGKRSESPMKTRVSPVGRVVIPGPALTDQRPHLDASTLIQRNPGALAQPVAAPSMYPRAEPPTHAIPPAPVPTHVSPPAPVPIPALPRVEKPPPVPEHRPQTVDKYLIAPPPAPPAITSQRAERVRAPWNWRLMAQVGGILGLLALVCLAAFWLGMRAVAPIVLPSY